MEWTMLYLFVGLKLPILAACWIIYWAVKAVPDPAEDNGNDGGIRKRPHAPPRLPRTPRRGPHGEGAPIPPARVRHVTARGRDTSSRH